jgi:hypothetical protein
MKRYPGLASVARAGDYTGPFVLTPDQVLALQAYRHEVSSVLGSELQALKLPLRGLWPADEWVEADPLCLQENWARAASLALRIVAQEERRVTQEGEDHVKSTVDGRLGPLRVVSPELLEGGEEGEESGLHRQIYQGSVWVAYGDSNEMVVPAELVGPRPTLASFDVYLEQRATSATGKVGFYGRWVDGQEVTEWYTGNTLDELREALGHEPPASLKVQPTQSSSGVEPKLVHLGGAGFMKRHVYEGEYWEVDGDEHEVVPASLVPRRPRLDDFKDYIEQRAPTSATLCTGFFGRMSAPGYMDATAWVCAPTADGVVAHLREMYEDGDDDDDGDDGDDDGDNTDGDDDGDTDGDDTETEREGDDPGVCSWIKDRVLNDYRDGDEGLQAVAYGREGSVSLYWWYRSKAATVQLYEAEVPEDVLDYHSWVDVGEIARFVGSSKADLRKQAKDPDWRVRADLLLSLIGYYASENFDGYPQTISVTELQERFPGE